MNDNIQVAVRVRPLITREKSKNESKLWNVSDGKYISQVTSPAEKFCFDRVFDTEEDNFDVYNDLCLPIVKSVMQGFNGTIFAYGQTSSGKTFTMMGEHNGIYKGVIQYSIADIFNMIQDMPDREFLLRVSFLEIYNEKVYDLLSDKNEDLKLLEDSYGIIKVNGLQEKIVQTAEQIWKWMRNGQKKRHTGETQMNRLSSRSHSIFRMIIESRLKDEDAAVVNVSQLNLVDLAGSENLKQTHSKLERFKEGVHINLSLSTLSQVISQLSEKDDQFINYRNSKLTRLLQNSLGGNALTAIICAVTPASRKETLSTINFAQRAKNIQNKPQKNEIFTDQALLKQYANQIKKLSQELQVSKEQGKELAEKTKQNENLKRQIEALKSNFVTQTVVNKSSRRETWGGHLDARRLQLENFASRQPIQSYFDLPTLEEEPEADVEISSFCVNSTFRKSSSSRISVLKNVSDAEMQTEPESEQKPGIDYEGSMAFISELKSKLTTLQTELIELQTYTTLEVQYMKAENELQTEIVILKNENCSLRERLDSMLNELPAQLDSDSPSLKKNVFEFSHNSCQTEEVFTPEKNLFPKEYQTSPLKTDANLKNLQDQNNKLEQWNQDLKHKLSELEASRSVQIEEFETAQSEWKAKSLLLAKELEAKYEKELTDIKHQLKLTENQELSNMKYLQDKNSQLEECNRDLKQKIIDLEASYCSQIKTLEIKFETAQSEWNGKSLSMIKELEKKYEKELANIEQLKATESHELNDLQYFRERIGELEECNRDLRQKITDLQASHCAQIETLEMKFETSQKELAKMRSQQKEIDSSELSIMKDLNEKNSLLEECNRDLKQKVTDLEVSHCMEIEAAKEKFETVQSKLHTTTKDLEAHQKELTEIKRQLKETENHELSNVKHFQEKYNELEQHNNNLRQKITELDASHLAEIKELEEDFEIKRSEWNAKTILLVKDIETKYSQELADQEDKLTEDMQAIFKERLQAWMNETCDLKKEISTMKSQNVELTNIKQHNLKRIEELEDQIYSESLEKVNLISQLKKEKDQDILACIAKYEKIVTEYRNKQRQCRDINRQLTNKVKYYMKEVEKIRDNQGLAESDNSHHLKEKLSDLKCERDILLEKYEAAKQEISKLKDNIEKYYKELNDQKMVLKDMCSNKELEESNKILKFDLDKKKAKIISLETNNASMIQEIKKLRDKLSSKSVSCKCKLNTKDLKTEIPGNCDDFKGNVENQNLEENTHMKVRENPVIKTRTLDEDFQKENCNAEEDQADRSDLYLIGGGSGPANMVKCYWLEGMLYKKDKEIKKLKKELAEMNSELTVIKTQPVLLEQKKLQTMKFDTGRTPISPLQERNDVTVRSNVVPPQCEGAIPKVFRKQTLKEKRMRKSGKPYELLPPESANMKRQGGELYGQLKAEMKENGQKPETSTDVVNMVSNPECRQQ